VTLKWEYYLGAYCSACESNGAQRAAARGSHPAALAPSRHILDKAARIVEHRSSTVRERAALNRSELCTHVAVAASLSRANAAFAIDAMFLAIADALARDETVSIAGFGKFTTKRRAARKGRNPRTGEAVAIAASRVPSFKAGKALRESVNE